MRWLYRNLWLPPLALALLIFVAGVWTHKLVDRQLSHDLIDDLTTIRDSTASALAEWMVAQERAAQTAAAEPDVIRAAKEQAALAARGVGAGELDESVSARNLDTALRPNLKYWGFQAYALLHDEVVIAASRAVVGKPIPSSTAPYRDRIMAGETVLTPPLELSTAGREEIFMWVATPVIDPETKQIVALLSFRIDPEQSFTRILRVSRFGYTGETFAFNREGVLISRTRLEEPLRDAGLLGKTDSPILRVRVRDPGADLTHGGKPVAPLENLPLTKAAASAIRGERNVDVKGYRDYRGVYVVGAWLWMPRYQIGISTEVDRTEAFRTLQVVRNAIWGLVGILVLAAAAVAFGSRLLAKQRDITQKVVRLGQYTLEHRIGEGGMGTVYRARHSFLRRPTALKVMRSNDITDADRLRFEREVQATSQLTHPNTIAIYDYGRAANGVFYYAMEYLEGITLAGLVTSDGAQPQGRVLFILRQMCGALAEAHRAGLVHRDIKPQNVMLCARGGLYDVAKVLDFGLVKSIAHDTHLTASNAITGTPHYMAPEAIQDPLSVDAHSDVYAVAAVAFYLLTGREVFVAASVMGVLTRTLTEDAPRPSSITSEPIRPELEALLLECLDRDPGKRPADAAVLLERLEALETPELAWPQSSAKAWWQAHAKLFEPKAEPPLSTAPTLAIDLEGRLGNGVTHSHITGAEPTILLERES